MAYFNVRLSAADEQVVKSLREDGVEVADVIRNALRQEHARRQRRPRSAKEVRDMLSKIEAKYPVPENLPPRTVDPLDRKAVREFIVAKIKSKGRK